MLPTVRGQLACDALARLSVAVRGLHASVGAWQADEGGQKRDGSHPASSSADQQLPAAQEASADLKPSIIRSDLSTPRQPGGHASPVTAGPSSSSSGPQAPVKSANASNASSSEASSSNNAKQEPRPPSGPSVLTLREREEIAYQQSLAAQVRVDHGVFIALRSDCCSQHSAQGCGGRLCPGIPMMFLPGWYPQRHG